MNEPLKYPKSLGESTKLMQRGDDLLERAAKLNKLSEVSQVALGMCLAQIKATEAFKGQYSDFKSYYQNELGRSKGDISKLLTVGQFMLDGGFPEETAPGYSKLYVALSVFPDKKPEYILAAAQSNTVAEMLENKRDFTNPNCAHDWLPHSFKECTKCSKRESL